MKNDDFSYESSSAYEVELDARKRKIAALAADTMAQYAIFRGRAKAIMAELDQLRSEYSTLASFKHDDDNYALCDRCTDKAADCCWLSASIKQAIVNDEDAARLYDTAEAFKIKSL